MANKSYLDYAGLKRILKTHKTRGMRYIFHGTQAEWDSLSAAEKNKYEQAEIIDSNYPEWLPLRLTPEKWPKNQKIVFDENTWGYRFYRAPGSAANAQGQQTGSILVPMDDTTNWAIIQSGGSAQRASDTTWHDLNTYWPFTDGNLAVHKYYFCIYPPIDGSGRPHGLSVWAPQAGEVQGVDMWCIVSKNTNN